MPDIWSRGNGIWRDPTTGEIVSAERGNLLDAASGSWTASDGGRWEILDGFATVHPRTRRIDGGAYRGPEEPPAIMCGSSPGLPEMVTTFADDNMPVSNFDRRNRLDVSASRAAIGIARNIDGIWRYDWEWDPVDFPDPPTNFSGTSPEKDVFAIVESRIEWAYRVINSADGGAPWSFTINGAVVASGSGLAGEEGMVGTVVTVPRGAMLEWDAVLYGQGAGDALVFPPVAQSGVHAALEIASACVSKGDGLNVWAWATWWVRVLWARRIDLIVPEPLPYRLTLDAAVTPGAGRPDPLRGPTRQHAARRARDARP